jgi:MarR family 2-MHQ and catechol resistance regulon transcriptional repressor
MGTNYKGSGKSIHSLNSYIKLLRAAESLSSKISLALSEYGLTESQFGALDSLFHLGPMKQKEIVKKILKSSGNITMVINNLEKGNLVLRKKSEKDKREFIIHLTQKGRNTINELLPHIVKKIKKHFEILSKEEQKTLQQLCKMVGLQVRN